MTPDEIRANVKALTQPVYEAAQIEAQKHPSHESALTVAAIAAGIALATDILITMHNLAEHTAKLANPVVDMTTRATVQDKIRRILSPAVDVNAPYAIHMVNALADLIVKPRVVGWPPNDDDPR